MTASVCESHSTVNYKIIDLLLSYLKAGRRVDDPLPLTRISQHASSPSWPRCVAFDISTSTTPSLLRKDLTDERFSPNRTAKGVTFIFDSILITSFLPSYAGLFKFSETKLLYFQTTTPPLDCQSIRNGSKLLNHYSLLQKNIFSGII